jgi:hypothetical protein
VVRIGAVPQPEGEHRKRARDDHPRGTVNAPRRVAAA